MIYSILIAVCIIAMIALLPVYLTKTKAGHTVKTLLLKGALSALFVCVALLSAFGFGNRGSRFAMLMLCGFFLSFIGDLLLHRDKGMPKFVVGGVVFLAAHVCFIIAYISTAKLLFPGQPFMTKGQIVALALLWAAVVGMFAAFKPNFKKLAPVIFLYAAVLMFMVVKAGYLGFLAVKAGLPNAAASLVLLAGGAGLFALSDSVLGVSFFTKPTHGKKSANVILYYCGQVMLALSLAFIAIG